MHHRPQLSSFAILCGLAWLMLAVPSHAHAQAAGEVWVFEFQDGSLVKGEVLYAGKTTYLVKTSDGTEVKVQKSDIAKAVPFVRSARAPEDAEADRRRGSGDDRSAERRSSRADKTERRARSAFFRINEARALQVTSGVVFGTGVGTLVGAVAVASSDEGLGLGLGLGGAAQITISAGLIVGAAVRASSGLDLYELRRSKVALIVGVSLQGIGVAAGAAAVVGIANEGEEYTGLGIASLSTALVGQIVG